MVWSFPPSLIAGGENVTQTITVDTYIGNLWSYLGSPAGPQSVNLTIDGADVGEIQITADWAGGSTFFITAINGGRILGLGGNGGHGGPDFGGTGDDATSGYPGTAAITSDGFTVNVDVDDGYLLGGGGGGGGGSYTKTGSVAGEAGGGGGGGQGFTGGDGGSRGLPNEGFPPPTDGGDGLISGPGAPGDGGGVLATSDGGAGGVWGSGGQGGRSSNMLQNSYLYYYGGIGGRGGAAFSPTNGATLNLNGSDSETTLRSLSRIKGDIDEIRPAYSGGGGIWFERVDVSEFGSNETGFVFQLTGDLTKGDLDGTPQNFTNLWLDGTSTPIAALYEIRERSFAGDIDGTVGWDTKVNATSSNWSALSSARTQSFTSAAGDQSASSLMEIRRNDVPGSPDNEIICSFYLIARDDNLI